MFPNLKAELARKSIKQRELADLLEMTVQAINYKINGKVEFKTSEMKLIRDSYFSNLPLDYLFKREM